jgi:hypothetical protein
MDNNNEIQVTVASDDSQGFTVGDGADGIVPHEENPITIDQEVEEKPKQSSRALRAEKLRQENAALRRQNEEMAQVLTQREQYLNQQQAYIEEQKKKASKAEVEAAESTLDEREQNILGRMKAAKEEGLVDEEILLTKELSKLQADRSALSLLSDMQETDNSSETYFQPEYQYRPPQHQEQQYPEAFYDYLERNPELDPNSSRFDMGKLKAAEDMAKNLTDMLVRDGHKHKIGTDFFYEVLDDAMKTSSRQPSTLGVSRNDQLYDMRSSGARNISKEELSFIRNLPVYLDDGTEASEQQKIERYLNAGKNINYRQSGSTRVV